MTHTSSIRHEYEKKGVAQYYLEHGNEYINPHYHDIHAAITKWRNLFENKSIIDLCAGSGEVSTSLKSIAQSIEGIDPFTYQSYQRNTRLKCHQHDFKRLAFEGFPVKADMIVCSYAIHLCPESMIHQLTWQMTNVCNELIILSPHKSFRIPDPFQLVVYDKIGKCRLFHYQKHD